MKKLMAILATGTLLFSCGGAMEKYDDYSYSESPEAVAEESSGINQNGSEQSVLSSSAAGGLGADTNRAFVRTADIRFRVKDVASSTYAIEDIVAKHGGFVTYTNLQNTIDRVDFRKISEDSTLESTYYTMNNSITLRLPNESLDKALREMVPLVDFMNHRLIRADDVSLNMLANQLRMKRLTKHNERVEKAIDEKGKKLNDVSHTEDQLLGKNEQRDNAYINKLQLEDQVEYSTVTLDIYQRQSIQREMIFNEENIEDYQPGFWTKIGHALVQGWKLLEALLVGIAHLWVLIVIGIIIWLILRRYLYNSTPKQ